MHLVIALIGGICVAELAARYGIHVHMWQWWAFVFPSILLGGGVAGWFDARRKLK